MLAHLDNVGELVGRLIVLGGGLEYEVFGDPSPDMRARWAVQPRISSTFQSMKVLHLMQRTIGRFARSDRAEAPMVDGRRSAR